MATQILGPQPGKHDKGVKWPNDEPETLSEDDNIDENGTDYKSVKKSFRLYKSLISDDDLLKAMDEEEEEEEDDHEDEDDDKKLIKEMMGAKEDKEELGKSFFEFVSKNETIVDGVNSSPFLFEMVKSIGYSFASFENRIGSMLYQMDHDHSDFAKSLDGVFESFGKSLGMINETAEDIDMQKSVEDVEQDAGYLEKGGFDSAENLTRGDILDILVKGVEEGNVAPGEVIKFEHTGVLSPNIQKSLGL